MKTLFTVLALVALTAGAAVAKPYPAIDNPYVLDVTDSANVLFVANTDTATINYTAYSIVSASGSGLDASAFTGIARRLATDPAAVPPVAAPYPGEDGMWVWANLGMGAMGFEVLNPNNGNLSEATLGAGATMQPGFALKLGAIGGSVEDLDFTGATMVGGVTSEWTGAIVPEPATMSLLVLGGLAVIRRRR